MAALRALGRLVVELQSEATVPVVSCGGGSTVKYSFGC